MDRSSKQKKINKNIAVLNNTLDQKDLIDIYRTVHPKEAKCAFFSSTHGSFSMTDYMLGHKMSLNKFKKIEIISAIFLDHNDLKLEANLKKKISKTFKYMEAK